MSYDTHSRLYVYGFIDGPAPAGLAGLDGEIVSTAGGDRLFAAVSATRRERLRPQRTALSAHHRVVSALAAERTVLPAAFGLIADSCEELEAMMAAHEESLLEELARVRGCVEVEIRLRWDVPDVFEHLISLDDDLRSQRDELASHGESAPHALKVAVGRRVERVIDSHRAAHGSVTHRHVAPACREIRELDPAGEAELAALSCLVEREQLGELEAGLARAAEALDETFAFELKGPFAPHSFVNLNLDFAAEAAG